MRIPWHQEMARGRTARFLTRADGEPDLVKTELPEIIRTELPAHSFYIFFSLPSVFRPRNRNRVCETAMLIGYARKLFKKNIIHEQIGDPIAKFIWELVIIDKLKGFQDFSRLTNRAKNSLCPLKIFL